jgi:cbb3-type cytochrome oxidase maturation protein
MNINCIPVNVIFVLIAVSLLVAVGFLATFIWTIRSGQYDDDYTPSVRILFDDERNVMEEDVRLPEPGKSGEPDAGDGSDTIKKAIKPKSLSQ